MEQEVVTMQELKPCGVRSKEGDMSEWISAEDRLPETDDLSGRSRDVLLYVPEREGVKQHGVYVGKIYPVKGDPSGQSNFWGIPIEGCKWTIHGWSYFEHPIVTHWMPLPDTPRARAERGQ